ncbi:MAG: zinc ribbon domain-containing protein [Methanosarcinales archaeon]
MIIVGWEWFLLPMILIIILGVSVGIIVIFLIIRALTRKEIIREKEIIKEVVMVRCSSCGRLMSQTANFCPYCGKPG